MNRDPRLHGLSSDHHHALVLARSVAARLRRGDGDGAAREVAERFAAELEPHFRIEEEVLLPALARAGARDLVERTERDHAFLRTAAAAAAAGRTDGLAGFAERLTEHVRFEERDLFPRCESALDAALDEVARRRPKPGGVRS